MATLDGVPMKWICPQDYDSADVLLINTPQRRYTQGNPRYATERVLPPIGLAYLATYLERHGLRAAILDGEFFGLSTDQIVEAASDFDARAYGVNCYSPTARLSYEIARGLNNCGQRVYMGGVHATYCEADVIRNCPFAIVMKGYAEQQLCQSLSAMNSNSTNAIDPMSLWLSRRHLASDPHEKRGMLTTCLLSSRGCPFACTFCTSAQTQYRLREPLSVAEEMEHLRRTYGVTHFQFLDDLFLVNPTRSEAFAEAFSSMGLCGISWQGLATVRTLFLHHHHGSITALQDSGCTQLSIGFESGSPRIRQLAGKQYDDSMAETIVESCAGAGIRVKGFFMIGFPGETREEMQTTIAFISKLRTLGLADISLFQVKLYPGTELYRKAIADFGPVVADAYYEYDLRPPNGPVSLMRAYSRESYGTSTRLSEVEPRELEQIIIETTTRFYEN